jgi:hypothetical protein
MRSGSANWTAESLTWSAGINLATTLWHQCIHVFLHSLLEFIRPRGAGLLAQSALRSGRWSGLGLSGRLLRGNFQFEDGTL